MSTPRDPVWRPWKDRSELPAEALSGWFRIRGDERSQWFKASRIDANAAFMVNGHWMAAANLFDAYVWSSNGRDWFTCGILCEDEK